MPEAIESAGTIPSLTSDHNAIYLHVNWKQSQIKNQTIEIWDYQNGNYNAIDLILGDLLQSVFFVVSAPDNIVQSRLVYVTKMAGF